MSKDKSKPETLEDKDIETAVGGSNSVLNDPSLTVEDRVSFNRTNPAIRVMTAFAAGRATTVHRRGVPTRAL